MRLLLDTHIWLWSRLTPAHLGKRLSRALEDNTHELWLSPLSVWEVQLLAGKGRIVLTPTAEDWIAAALGSLPMKEPPLTFEVARATAQVRLPHRDPVDQLLAATARVYDLTLVTADSHLLQGTGFSVLPNR
jgi:PIN domain nuclease of toxin-antitoxin system